MYHGDTVVVEEFFGGKGKGKNSSRSLRRQEVSRDADWAKKCSYGASVDGRATNKQWVKERDRVERIGVANSRPPLIRYLFFSTNSAS